MFWGSPLAASMHLRARAPSPQAVAPCFHGVSKKLGTNGTSIELPSISFLIFLIRSSFLFFSSSPTFFGLGFHDVFCWGSDWEVQTRGKTEGQNILQQLHIDMCCSLDILGCFREVLYCTQELLFNACRLFLFPHVSGLGAIYLGFSGTVLGHTRVLWLDIVSVGVAC